jgi:hypothetical protein
MKSMVTFTSDASTIVMIANQSPLGVDSDCRKPNDQNHWTAWTTWTGPYFTGVDPGHMSGQHWTAILEVLLLSRQARRRSCRSPYTGIAWAGTSSPRRPLAAWCPVDHRRAASCVSYHRTSSSTDLNWTHTRIRLCPRISACVAVALTSSTTLAVLIRQLRDD